jgi:hypothetical protein
MVDRVRIPHSGPPTSLRAWWAARSGLRVPSTAPFRSNAYAYYDRSDRRYSNSSDRGCQSWDKRTYAQRNGFVCEPGKRFKGEDGKQHMCQ